MKWTARQADKYTLPRGNIVLVRYKKKVNQESIAVLGFWVSTHYRTYSRVGKRKYCNLIELGRNSADINMILNSMEGETCDKMTINGLKALIRENWRTFIPSRVLQFKQVENKIEAEPNAPFEPVKPEPAKPEEIKKQKSGWLKKVVNFLLRRGGK